MQKEQKGLAADNKPQARFPKHAAANQMSETIYARDGHLHEAIGLMEKALRTSPWHDDWWKCPVPVLGMETFGARTEEVKARPHRQPTLPACPGDAPYVERPSCAAIDDLDAELESWSEVHHEH